MSTRSADRGHGWARLLLVAALTGAPLGAAAQVSEEDGRRAVALGQEAIRLFDAGRHAEAHDRFAAAEHVVHSPVFVLYMARSKRALGELLAARDGYRSVRDESLPADAPEPWRRAQAEATAELAGLDPRIPSLHVRVVGAAELFLDGAPIAPGTPMPLEVDPGRHTVAARDASGRATERVLSLREGEQQRITLQLPPAEATPGPLWPGGMVLGLGLGGLAAGAITGVIAKLEADDIKSRCLGNSCLAVDADRADQARALATASTACLVVGGAIAATGVVLMVLRPGGEAPESLALEAGPAELVLRAVF